MDMDQIGGPILPWAFPGEKEKLNRPAPGVSSLGFVVSHETSPWWCQYTFSSNWLSSAWARPKRQNRNRSIGILPWHKKPIIIRWWQNTSMLWYCFSFLCLQCVFLCIDSQLLCFTTAEMKTPLQLEETTTVCFFVLIHDFCVSLLLRWRHYFSLKRWCDAFLCIDSRLLCFTTVFVRCWLNQLILMVCSDCCSMGVWLLYLYGKEKMVISRKRHAWTISTKKIYASTDFRMKSLLCNELYKQG